MYAGVQPERAEPPLVKGGFPLREQEEVLQRVEELSRCRLNDSIRLAFLTGEELDVLDRLDLSPITEFKRNKDGGVEMKFVDRLSALQWLAAQLQAKPQADELRQALAAGGRGAWGSGGENRSACPPSGEGQAPRPCPGGDRSTWGEET